LADERGALQARLATLESDTSDLTAKLDRQVDLERRYSERVLQLERALATRKGHDDRPADPMEWGRQAPLWDDA
jgi:hypothetical protein